MKEIDGTNIGLSTENHYGPISDPILPSVDNADQMQPASESPIRRLPVPEQPNPTYAVDPSRKAAAVDESLCEVLRDAATELEATFDGTVPPGQEDEVEAWCSMHGLNIDCLSAVLPRLARHAVLSVFVKAVLYECRRRNSDFPELTLPVNDAFQTVYRKMDASAFEQTVPDRLATRLDKKTVQTLLDARDQILDARHPAIALGDLYEAVTDSETRQQLGQFYTPRWLTELMRMWVPATISTLLDLGVGAGSLDTPVYPRWSVDLDPDHVIGVDRSPLARLMATTALTLAGQSHEIRVEDFLALAPDDLTADVDAVIANPPYTDLTTLPDEYVERMQGRLERVTGRDISQNATLTDYFLFNAREFLDPGDRAVFLTSQNWLTTNRGVALKDFLLDEFDITALVQFDPSNESAFAHAQTTSLILFLEARTDETTPGLTRFVRMDEPVHRSAIEAAITREENTDTDWGAITCIDQTELEPEDKWQALFDIREVDTEGLTPLGDIVSVHRGKTAGYVDFFCLSNAEAEAAGLDERHLSRLIRRPSYIDGYDVHEADWEAFRDAGKEVWLFDPDEDPAFPESPDAVRARVQGDETGGSDIPDTDVAAYLESGVLEHDLDTVDALYERPLWYQPRREPARRVLVQAGSRGTFDFILNETDARHINNFYAFDAVTLNDAELKALIAFLNSGVFEDILYNHRYSIGDGFDKLNPGDVEDVSVLDPRDLVDDAVARLAALFDDLRETARSGGDAERVIARIDATIAQIRAGAGYIS